MTTGTAATKLRAGLDEVREFFLLREAERRSAALDAPVRDELARMLRLAEQRQEAADLLFQHGARAEALRLAEDAYALLRPLAAKIEAPVTVDPLLAEVGDPASAPELEDELTPAHEERFRRVNEATALLHRDLAPVALDKPARLRRRINRIAISSALFLAVVGLSVAWARRVVITAEASAIYGGKYGPENAIDGMETTHWLLPDKTPGYIELKLSPSRKLKTVSILNGYDPVSYGTVDYRLEAWSGTVIVKQQDLSFKDQPAGVKPPWVDIPFATDRKIDKVRIVVKTHRALGGGIAEVKID